MAVPRAVRSFIGISCALQPVDPAPVGEEQQVGVGGGVDDARDVVSSASLAPGHAPAAPALGAEGVGRHRLDVAGLGHGDDELLVVDEVLDVDVARVEGDLGPAGLWRTWPGPRPARP